jgi:hypothetical protein
VNNAVSNFVNHILEDVDDELSSPMRAAENQLTQQEMKLRWAPPPQPHFSLSEGFLIFLCHICCGVRQLREAVDRERKAQDSVLKDLRSQTSNLEGPNAAAGNLGGNKSNANGKKR